MINLAIGIYCTAVGFIPPLDWMSGFNFFMGGLNIGVGFGLLARKRYA